MIAHRILPGPIQQRIEIAALFDGAEVGEGLEVGAVGAGLAAAADPVVGDDVDVSVTHDVLQQHMQAVALVILPTVWHADPSAWVGGGVVVVPMGVLAQLVQTVDLVEDVDLRDVGVGPALPGGRGLDGELGGLVRVANRCRGDGDELVRFRANGVPGGVDERGGVAPEYGIIAANVPVQGGEARVEGYGVEDGRWMGAMGSVSQDSFGRGGKGGKFYSRRKFSSAHRSATDQYSGDRALRRDASNAPKPTLKLKGQGQ